MVLNTKAWESVKHCDFIVGDRDLFDAGVTYHPGDDYPKGNLIALHCLYLTSQITEKLATPEPTKKAKRIK